MPTELADPPLAPRARELWLQRAAGRILIRDSRDYARSRLPESLSESERSAALAAIDDALYGLMMIADGVTGALRSDRFEVTVTVHARLRGDNEVLSEMNLAEGDGMCMGVHAWLEGDFGDAS